MEWITKDPAVSWKTLPELNEWYNSKEILFGMVAENRHEVTFVPTRFYETIASGSPLIMYKINGIKECTDIDYPWLTESREQTEAMIDDILGNYEQATKKVLEWSEHIRTNHSYKMRLEELFKVLKND